MSFTLIFISYDATSKTAEWKIDSSALTGPVDVRNVIAESQDKQGFPISTFSTGYDPVGYIQVGPIPRDTPVKLKLMVADGHGGSVTSEQQSAPWGVPTITDRFDWWGGFDAFNSGAPPTFFQAYLHDKATNSPLQNKPIDVYAYDPATGTTGQPLTRIWTDSNGRA